MISSKRPNHNQQSNSPESQAAQHSEAHRHQEEQQLERMASGEEQFEISRKSYLLRELRKE